MFVIVCFRSFTTVPKKLFENAELVSSNDPNLDVDNLVYMDTDSNESDVYETPIQDAPRLEIVGFQTNDVSIDITDTTTIHVKREEEFIIDDEPIQMDDLDYLLSESFNHDIDPKSPESSFEIVEVKEEVEDIKDEVTVTEVDASLDLTITRIDPDSDMPTPPENIDDSQRVYEEQFQLINDLPDNAKTEANATMNSSLVDHPYSQPEITNNDFCDEIVQNMLKDTGINTPSAVQLLSKFTEMIEQFFVEDTSSQLTLYLRSMKSTLHGLEKKSEPENAAVPAQLEEVEPFTEVPETQELVEEKLVNGETQECPEIPATQSTENLIEEFIADCENEEQVIMKKENEADETLTGAEDEVEDVAAEEEKEAIKEENNENEVAPENDVIVQHKLDCTRISDLGLKLSNDANELMNVSMDNDEAAADAKNKLIQLLKDFRIGYRALSAEIIGECSVKKEKKMNQESKKKLEDSSSEAFSSDSDSDGDQVVNLNRKIPKNSPQTPAIVSSTKEDSDITDIEQEEMNSAAGSRSISPESGTGKPKNEDKEIEKLLDFTSLNCPKPASSRKVSKSKKAKKKEKKENNDIDKLLETSEDDSELDHSSSSSVSLMISR